MLNSKERLEKLDDIKLIDIVKNYRQYGYNDQLRRTAVAILQSRGLSAEHLQLKGVFQNKKYENALGLFNSFRKSSNITFTLYALILLINIVIPIIQFSSEYTDLLLLCLNWVTVICYFIFLYKSFVSQRQFFKLVDDDYRVEGALLYILVGMPFYFIIYFFFRNQMKEKMKEVT